MECLYCGKEIPDEQAKEIEEIGVEPYCDNYCFSMDNYGYSVGSDT